ncbi:MAG: MATE family efflux transporter [Anaerofustis sp.]
MTERDQELTTNNENLSSPDTETDIGSDLPHDKHDRMWMLSGMPIKQAVWALGVPMILSMLVQVIYNMTDTFFIGQLNNPNMVAAISVCLPIAYILQTFGNIFSIGGASLISRMLGSGEKGNASHAAAISFWSTCVLSLIGCVVGYLYLSPILRLVGASDQTIGYAETYLKILLVGGTFIGAQMALGGLIRSEGATKESMIGMVIGSVLNIVLDPIFILWMDMGVDGAALATVIGNTVGFGYYILFYLRKKGIISINIRNFSFEGRYYAEIFKIGVPASLGFLVMSLGMALSNVIAAGYGDDVVASFSIVYRITSIGFMIVLGLAEGCQPLMGYSYGARNYRRLFDTIRYANIVSTLICLVFAVVFFLFPEAWIAVFMKNEDVISIGSTIMRVMLVSMPFWGVQVVLLTLFQAIGKPIQSMVISLGRQGLFLVPFLFLFTRIWGYMGFIWAEPTADVFTSVLAVVLYYAMKNKFERMKDEEGAVL